MNENNIENNVYCKYIFYEENVEIEGPTKQLVIGLAINKP